MHGVEGSSGRNLHFHAVAQQLIDAQIRLIERDAGRVRGGQQFLQGAGDMGFRVAARFQIVAQQVDLDAAVVLPPRPIAKVTVAKAVGSSRVREEGGDAVLRPALGARLLRHGLAPERRAASCR